MFPILTSSMFAVSFWQIQLKHAANSEHNMLKLELIDSKLFQLMGKCQFLENCNVIIVP